MSNSYQDSIEAKLGLSDSDDLEDISVGEKDLSSDVRRKGNPSKKDEEDEELQDTEGETDEEDEPEEVSEPSYKKEVVQKIIKNRVGTLNKRIERLSGYKGAIDRICEITGLDYDSLVSRLEGMTEAQQAQVLGVPVEQVRKARADRRTNQKHQSETFKLRVQLGMAELRQDKRFSDVDLFKEEIDEILLDNPKLTIKQAYMLAKGDLAITAASRDAEQRQIAKRVQTRSKKVVQAPGSSSAPKGPKITSENKKAAQLAGMEVEEYLAYSSITSLDDYNNFKKSKKG